MEKLLTSRKLENSSAEEMVAAAQEDEKDTSLISNSAATRKLSEETKAKLRQINLGKKHSEETKAKMSEAQLNRELSETEKEELCLAKAVLDKLPAIDDNRNLLALRHGLGIYRRHAFKQINLICAMDRNRVPIVLEQIIAGQLLPARGLEFNLLRDSLNPFFRNKSQLKINQLWRLTEVLPKLDNQEGQMAIWLFGFNGQPKLEIDEINRRLYHSSPLGKQKIRSLKRNLETHMNAY